MIDFIIQISRVSPFFASAVSLGIGAVVFRYNRTEEKNRAFFYFSVVLAIWAFGCFIQSITSSPSVALIWDKILYSAAVFAPILLFNLCISFTKKSYSIIKIGAWVIGGFLLFLNWFGYFRDGVCFNFGARFVTTPSYGWYGYLTLYGILIGLALYELILEWGRQTGSDKQRSLYLFAAMFVLILGGNSYFILVLVKITPLIDSLLNLFSSLFLATYCLIMSYLIIKHELMDIDLIVTRSAAYIITISSVIITFSIVPLIQQPTAWVVAGLLGLFWARYGQEFHLFVQTTAEKKFLKGTYNYSVVLAKFISQFSRCTSVSDIAKALDTIMVEDMEIRASVLLIPDGFDEKKELSGPYIPIDMTLDIKIMDNELVLEGNGFHQLYTSTDSPQLASLINRLGCAGLAPCFHNGELMGILLLGEKMSAKNLTQNDRNLIPLLSAQIGIVLNRLRQIRFEAELNIAQRIQSEILPSSPTIPNLELSCLMIPATEMGGDYYDIIHSDTGTWILLGDVTGHGVGSAMVMFMVQSIITTLINSKSVSSPSELLFSANQILCQNMQRLAESRPLTIVAFHTTDGKHFRYCGSHDAIQVLRKESEEIETIQIDQFPFGIGMIDDMTLEEFTEGQLTLSTDDIIFIGTDGITEAAKEGKYSNGTYGEDGLAEFMIAHRHLSMNEFSDALINTIRHYTGNIIHDDITFIVARSLPEGGLPETLDVA